MTSIGVGKQRLQAVPQLDGFSFRQPKPYLVKLSVCVDIVDANGSPPW